MQSSNNAIQGEMERRYSANDFADVLELGNKLSVAEQLSIQAYNGAAFTIYSWGYLTAKGDTAAAREIFRKFVRPDYIQQRHDMSLELINFLNRKDAQIQI